MSDMINEEDVTFKYSIVRYAVVPIALLDTKALPTAPVDAADIELGGADE